MWTNNSKFKHVDDAPPLKEAWLWLHNSFKIFWAPVIWNG